MRTGGTPMTQETPIFHSHPKNTSHIVMPYIYIYRYGVSCYPVGNEHSSGKSPLSHGENHRTKWAMFNSKLLVYLRWIPSEIRWKNPIEHHEIPKSSIFIGGSIWNPLIFPFTSHDSRHLARHDHIQQLAATAVDDRAWGSWNWSSMDLSISR